MIHRDSKVRFITHHDLLDYQGWDVSYYGVRGDDLHCFVASFWCNQDTERTATPALLARRTMSAVPFPPGNATTKSGLPSSSIR
jgi:hypothetical protein